MLYSELYEVVNWYSLGQALLVPEYELQTIRLDYPNDTVRSRDAMLSWWWNNAEETTWLALVQALAKTGSHRYAKKLAIKFGK